MAVAVADRPYVDKLLSMKTPQSAIEIGQRIASGELTSEEATAASLEVIKQTESQIGAFTHVCEEYAMDTAAEVDRQIKAGKLRGPLAGVPVAIKDVLCTKFAPTTCGSRMLANHRSPYNATAVEKMLAAGMVPLGKTNMDEFAMGGSTETSHHGLTRNPWNLEKTAGGSSGGAAAAVAAGQAVLSIGSDTGGSVRQPAAFCGVLGLKPTYGRISRYGLVAFASSLDQVGPLGTSAADLAAMLGILAGHDSRDSTSLSEPVPSYSGELSTGIAGLKVGVITDHAQHSDLNPEMAAAVESAKQALQECGAEVVDVRLPHTQYSVPAYYVIAPSEASGNLSRYDGVHYGYRTDGPHRGGPLDEMISASRSEGFGDEVQRRIMLGTFALSSGYYDAYYKKALQVRRMIASDYQNAFKEVDLLLGPVTPSTAFGLGEKVDDPVQMYLEDLFTVGANLAGVPGISVPTGLSSDGLPLAVQLQAPLLGESTLLRAAHALEAHGLVQCQLASPS